MEYSWLTMFWSFRCPGVQWYLKLKNTRLQKFIPGLDLFSQIKPWWFYSFIGTILWKFRIWELRPVQSVQFSRSVVSHSLQPHEPKHARPPFPSPTPGVHPNSIVLGMLSSHLILCHPLLLLPSIFPSISVFSSESALRIRWPKYWSFSFNISPSNEHPGLMSFRMDWLDLLAIQGTLKSLLQHHSSKASIPQLSAFFIVQLSHPYMTTGKTIALTRWTFVGKVMSLLFNMLSRLVITFLLRSKRLLISWLQSPSAVILEPPKYKVSHCFHCFPIYLPWHDGIRCHGLRFLNVEL